METLFACPSCQSAHFVPQLAAKDWLVTSETFELVRCTSCTLVFTNPRPAQDAIGRYYQSDAYVSHTNTRKGLMSMLYQAVRSYTLGQKAALIYKLNGNKVGHLLDVGCATGHFLALCAAKGWQTQGTEPDAGARAMAVAKGLSVAEVIFDVPATAQFDVVTLWHVLEHVHTLRASVAHMGALLRPGGTLVIAVPNHESYDAQHYGPGWAAYDVPRHLYHFSKSALKHLIEAEGMHLQQVMPMYFDAYYVALLSEKNKGGSLVNAIRMGYISNQKAAKSGAFSSLIYVCKKLA